MVQKREQWLSLRRGTVNAPMSRYELMAMIIMIPLAAADPPDNKCLPSPGTIVTGSCTECLEPIWSNTCTTKTLDQRHKGDGFPLR